MLVVAATEPCSLLHSIPSKATDLPKPTQSTTAQPFPSVPSTIPVVTVLPTQVDDTAQPSSSGTSSESASTSSACFSLLESACSSSAMEHANKSQPEASSSLPQEPSTSKEESSQVMMSQLKSEPEAVAYSLSAMSIDSASTSVSMPSNQDNPSQSQMSDQDSEHRPRVLKCIVNFDKIYEYLSDPESKTCSSALTSMGMYC